MRRIYLVICGIALLGVFAPLTARGLSTGTVTVSRAGVVMVDAVVAPDALKVSVDQETILIPLHTYVPAAATSARWLLELPVIMAAEWEPELIPSRCACRVNVERLDEYTYELEMHGLGGEGEVILRADFPPGVFELPTGQQILVLLARSSPWLLGLAVLFLVGSIGVLIWMAREMAVFRKFKLQPTLVTTPPNDVPPAMISLLPTGKITSATLAAMLTDLAKRHYLTLIDKGETFLLAEDRRLDMSGPGFGLGSTPGAVSEAERAKAAKEGVSIAEKFLLAKLFTEGSPAISREELKERLGRHLESAKIGKVYAELYQEATDRGFFIKNPHLVHLQYRLVGIAIFFAGLIGLGFTLLFDNGAPLLPLVWVAIALAGYSITRMVSFLPLLTVMGQAEWVRWSGFRAYLTDPDPLPAKTPISRFFDYLPYALAWGVLPAWSQRFGTRLVTAPNWYLTSPTKQPAQAMAGQVGHLTAFVSSILAAIHEHTRN